jgi:type II secretory pathway component HofQ
MAAKLLTILLSGYLLWGSSHALCVYAQTTAAADKPQETAAADPMNKPFTPPAPVIEIKRLEAEEPVYSIELRNVDLIDLFRVMAHDYSLNMVVDSDVSGTLTASFTNVSLEEALQTIAEMSNLVVRKKGNIIRISLNLVTKTFTLKNIEANKLLSGQRAATGTAAGAATGTAAGAATGTAAGAAALPGAAAASGTAATTSLSNIYDLLSDKGKILVGNQPNSIMVIDYPVNIEKVSMYLDAVDLRMSSRVFKLKYLKAGEVVGDQQPGSSAAAQTGSGGVPAK